MSFSYRVERYRSFTHSHFQLTCVIESRDCNRSFSSLQQRIASDAFLLFSILGSQRKVSMIVIDTKQYIKLFLLSSVIARWVVIIKHLWTNNSAILIPFRWTSPSLWYPTNLHWRKHRSILHKSAKTLLEYGLDISTRIHRDLFPRIRFWDLPCVAQSPCSKWTIYTYSRSVDCTLSC